MISIWTTETCYEIADRRPKFAVIPIGSFEQHGKHLPVITDTLIAGLIGKSVCDKYGGLLVSPITVTCSHEHAGFPASLSISTITLVQLLKDMVASIKANGFKVTILINGHGGNYVVGNVVQELNIIRPHVMMFPAKQHWQAALMYAGIEKTISEDMHGGEIETSILLYAMPEVVRTEKTEDWEATDRPYLTLFGMRHYTKSGVIGFPSKATAEKGRFLMEKLTELLGQDIAGFLAQA